MTTRKPKNILVAPLDWGAGHTTRCIPIVKALLACGAKPIVAGNTHQLRIFTETFPGIQSVLLDGYNIRYSAANRFFQAGLLSQLPGLLQTIKKEHQWLSQKTSELQLDGIISDNRYGLYSRSVPSVILCHQPAIKSGVGNGADNLVQRMHYRYLNRFSSVWIPDTASGPGLGGRLSHCNKMPEDYFYIGWLSRFAGLAMEQKGSRQSRLLILLSGPEPQRTILSDILWSQALAYPGKVVFAEGSDNAPQQESIPEHISYHTRLGQDALTVELTRADIVVCRSGYSTLMDLVATGKRAILIPTPGQTEQEYLGKHLHERGVFYCATQQNFNLTTAVNAISDFPFSPLTKEYSFDLHKNVVHNWLASL